VILTGDLTKLGGAAQARNVIEAIAAVNPVVLAQIGNMDRQEINDWLETEGINLHRKVRELAPDVALMGVGGSTFTPFGTPSEFPEARFAEWLDMLAKRASGHKVLVLIAHNPPFDTVCDLTSEGRHVGSHAVREFIEEHQPDICLCGHIHESTGQQLLGRTVVVNPGAFAAGGYALLRLAEGVSVSLNRLEA
jgi:Icc-related predicted phosphoesterase